MGVLPALFGLRNPAGVSGHAGPAIIPLPKDIAFRVQEIMPSPSSASSHPRPGRAPPPSPRRPCPLPLPAHSSSSQLHLSATSPPELPIYHLKDAPGSVSPADGVGGGVVADFYLDGRVIGLQGRDGTGLGGPTQAGVGWCYFAYLFRRSVQVCGVFLGKTDITKNVTHCFK